MRPYPSAAPLTTPSNRARTDLRPGVASAASTMCSSVVPGLANKVVTPDSTNVRIRQRAPSTVCLLSGSLFGQLARKSRHLRSFGQPGPTSNLAATITEGVPAHIARSWGIYPRWTPSGNMATRWQKHDHAAVCASMRPMDVAAVALPGVISFELGIVAQTFGRATRLGDAAADYTLTTCTARPGRVA